MDDLGVLIIVEVGADQQALLLEQPLHPLGALLGQQDALVLLVIFVVVGRHLLHDPVERHVELGLVLGRAGDDQRGAGLVDQDGVDFVDNGVVEGTLHHLLALVFHIVAQIVEAELVVRAVGDVAEIGGAALEVRQVRDDHADGQAEEPVDLAHPVRVALGEIVVHGDDVNALPFQRVQIDGQRRDEGLALAGPHLGDLAAVEDNAADHLHVIMTLAERTFGRLANGGEGLGQDVVEGLARLQPVLENPGLLAQPVVGHHLQLGLEGVDLVHDLAERADVAVVGRPENGFGKSTEHLGDPDLYRSARRRVRSGMRLWKTAPGGTGVAWRRLIRAAGRSRSARPALAQRPDAPARRPARSGPEWPGRAG